MKNIVVIGGGFAGTTVVKQLERHLPSGWQPVLVSEENYLTYTPLLPEVSGASLLPSHAVAPIRKMLARARYYQARVQDVDLQSHTIELAGDANHTIPYQHLIFACGKVSNFDIVDGMAEFALPLKTLGDALHIRNQSIASLERAELEDDPLMRNRLTTFIIIGGGTSGVEVAGAVADFLDAAGKYYPRIQYSGIKVVLLENGERLLSEFPESLGKSAHRLMDKNGIDIHLNTMVSKVTSNGVEVEGGGWIEGNNVICTIGTVPNELIQRLDLTKEKGLIKTLPDLSVPDVQGVWAIGDCAAIVNQENDALSPPTAQFAVRQGKHLAKNIMNVINGKPVSAFSYRSRGQLATIGHRRAVAHVLGIKLSGFPAWLLWRAVYLLMLPTLLRKLEVFSEWSLELLFPRDLSQLHFSRTQVRRSDIKNKQ